MQEQPATHKVEYEGATTFTNTYEASGDVQFAVNKELDGRKLEEGQFSFELKDKDGKVLQTKTNAANGTVLFDAIKYTQESVDPTTHKGTFTYTVTEVNDGNDGYSYSENSVKFTVEVTDNGSGELTAVYTSEGELTFINTYEAEGSAVLEVTKALTGRKLEEGQFTFQVKDKDGKRMRQTEKWHSKLSSTPRQMSILQHIPESTSTR